MKIGFSLKGLALCILIACWCSTASALTFSFSFTDDATVYLFGRTHVVGTVTGLLVGLSDNANNQIPTSIVLTSDESALGITNNVITNYLPTPGIPFNVYGPQTVVGSGFNVSGGSIVAADFLADFAENPGDPNGMFFQLRLNSTSDFPSGENLLMWNLGPGPSVVTGNGDGFIGTTYSLVTPLPAALPLFASGLGALGLLGWRRKRKAAAIAA
jgi:hypothetical protein